MAGTSPKSGAVSKPNEDYPPTLSEEDETGEPYANTVNLRQLERAHTHSQSPHHIPSHHFHPTFSRQRPGYATISVPAGVSLSYCAPGTLRESNNNASTLAPFVTYSYSSPTSKQEYYTYLRHPPGSRPPYNEGDCRSWSAGVGAGGGSTGVNSVGEGTEEGQADAASMRGAAASSSSRRRPPSLATVCIVTMLDGTEQEFKIDKTVRGNVLFEMVCHHLDLLERDYFGLTYRDTENMWFWLTLEKKISKQLGKAPWRFDFQVKFYPPDPNSLREELTRYYLCLQVRQDLVCGKLPCSFTSFVLLGAYIVQSEIGDHEVDLHLGHEYIKDMPFAPQRLQTPEMLQRIVELHKQLKGQTPEEADINFLENARKLAMYGVDLHRVKDNQNEDLMVGVYSVGILIYRGRLRINRFSWPKIDRLTYVRNHFKIVVRPLDGDNQSRVFEFKCANRKIAKRLWKSCVEHHSFFRLRHADNQRRPNLLLGRRFRYSGPTMFQVQQYPLDRTQPRVKRIPPTRLDRPPDGMYGTINPFGTYGGDPSMWYPTATVATMSGGAVGAGSVMMPSNYGDYNDVSRPALPPAQLTVSRVDKSPGIILDTNSSLAVTVDISSAGEGEWVGCRANWAVFGGGRFYYECRVIGTGPVRVGWSTNDCSLMLGEDRASYGYGSPELVANNHPGSGVRVNAGQTWPFGDSVLSGDLIGCLIDLDHGVILWIKSGHELGAGFHIPKELRSEAFFPTATFKNCSLMFNFGDTDLSYLPRGWTPVSTAHPDQLVSNRHQGWRLNTHDATEGLALSPDGLVAQAGLGRGWQCCRSNQGVRSHGRFYYEVKLLEKPCLVIIGWGKEEGQLQLGADKGNFGYGIDQERETEPQPLNVGDILGCLLDLDSWSLNWTKNGEEFGPVYRIRPDLRSQVFYPCLAIKNSTVEINFGDSPLKYLPDGHCLAVSQAESDVTRYTKKKGPELPKTRKVKGWSYTDTGDLEDSIRSRNKRIVSQSGAQEPRSPAGPAQPPPISPPIRSVSCLASAAAARSQQRSSLSNVPSQGPNDHQSIIRGIRPDSPAEPPKGSVIEGKCSVREAVRLRELNHQTKTVDQSEPEVETVTYTDEHGNKVTKIIKRVKVVTRVTSTKETENSYENEKDSHTPVVNTHVSRYQPGSNHSAMNNSHNHHATELHVTHEVPTVLTKTNYFKYQSGDPVAINQVQDLTGSMHRRDSQGGEVTEITTFHSEIPESSMSETTVVRKILRSNSPHHNTDADPVPLDPEHEPESAPVNDFNQDYHYQFNHNKTYYV